MNKLSLNKTDFSGKEILSRNQLKKITGGNFGTQNNCLSLCTLEPSIGTTVYCGDTAGICTAMMCMTVEPGCSCENLYGYPECD